MDENIIVELENQNVVTSTFRRLSPSKKDKIYKTALRAFGENVYESVILGNVAESAKVSKGSLIQYFEYKENLLLFLDEMVVFEYKSYFDDYFLGETAVRTVDRLEQFFLNHLTFQKSNGAEFAFILRMIFENSNDLSGRFVNRIFEIQKEYLQKIIKRGIESNQLRRDLKLYHLIFVLHSIFIGLLREHFLDKETTQKNDFQTDLNQCLNIVFERSK